MIGFHKNPVGLEILFLRKFQFFQLISVAFAIPVTIERMQFFRKMHRYEDTVH